MAKKTRPTVKSLSFTEEYKDELEHFCKQKNSSEYVCNLIRKDRLAPEENIEDAIQKALQEQLTKLMATSIVLPVREKEEPTKLTQKDEDVQADLIDDDIMDDYI